ncbi:MAG: hypothetical protein LBD68_09315, partial [Zoogloeaceae bacterium]|nr:hypothetical protein [Zoogloeaceae bacterium]
MKTRVTNNTARREDAAGRRGAEKGLARALAWTAAASLAVGAALAADPPSVTLPDKFEAPAISNMPLGLGMSLSDNIMLLLNTGSVAHYGYLPTTGDRYGIDTGGAVRAANEKPYYSSYINKIYYNPSIEYKKPYGPRPGVVCDPGNPKACEFPDMEFTAAYYDGYQRLGYYGDLHSSTAVNKRNTKINLGTEFKAHHWYEYFIDYPHTDDPTYRTKDMTLVGKRAHYNRYDTTLAGCWHKDSSTNIDYYYYGVGTGDQPPNSSTDTGGTTRDYWIVGTSGNGNAYNHCFEPIIVGSAADKDSYYNYSCEKSPEWYDYYNMFNTKACTGWWKDEERGHAITADDKKQNFANWFSYYYNPGSMQKTVLSHALQQLDPDTRIGYAVTGCASGCVGGTGGDINTNPHHTDLIGNNGGSTTIDGSATADFVIRGVRPFRDFDNATDYPACPNGKCKTELLNWLFRFGASSEDYSGYVSLRKSLAAVGAYYMNNTEKGPWSSTPGFKRAADPDNGIPATRYQACRKSYVLIMAGGNFDEAAPANISQGGVTINFRDADSKEGEIIPHADPTKTPYKYMPMLPFRDHATNTLDVTTLADVAMTFWKNDLFPSTGADGANNVPTGTQDPAFWQHMNVVAIHTDADAYSVNWKKIVATMNARTVTEAADILGTDWGYPGPSYTSQCGLYLWDSSNHGDLRHCPNPSLSGWGNPNGSTNESRREAQPQYYTNGDDLMHAAINSRGFYASTLDPSEIADLIMQGLSFVRKENAISMSTSTTNTASQRVPMIYQAAFNDDWNGKLIGNRLCTAADVARDYKWDPAANGGEGAATTLLNDSRCKEEGDLWFKASWDAGIELQNQVPSARNIFAWQRGVNHGVGFGATFFSTGEMAEFCVDPAACADEFAYFHGDDSKEARYTGGEWRSRVNAFKTDETVNRDQTIVPDGNTPRVLGDIVNSNPLFVGRDDYGWANFGGINKAMRQAYRKRKTVNRTEVIYVGANDGMLHAFNAAPGEAANGVLGAKNGGGRELFAYVPGGVWRKLKALRDTAYTHEFYVDGSPMTGDAYLGNGNSTEGWNTVLIGSLGMGGAGYFALDIEKPDAFNVNNVLWDISGPNVERVLDGAKTSKTISPPYTGNFIDLGYSVGQASIIALKSAGAGASDDPPKWFAMFANGYDSYLDRPMLYIVDLATGAAATSLRDNLGLVNAANADEGYVTEGPTKPNGLSTPIAVDLNSDGLADVIYAGDLRGNLWRFR